MGRRRRRRGRGRYRPRILSDASVERPLNLQYPWWMNRHLVLIAPEASRFMGVVMVLITQKKRGVGKLRASIFSPSCSEYHHDDFCYFSESDDEFGTTIRGVPYPQPVVYKYPDAHPDLEKFPRSEWQMKLAALQLTEAEGVGKYASSDE